MAAEHLTSQTVDSAISADVAAILAEFEASVHPSGELARTFAEAALRRAPAYLLMRPVDAVAGRLRATFEALREHTEDETSVRIAADTAAGSRAHRVIEVISEDRPFLLSTVRAQAEAAGCEVLGAFHPIVGVVRDDAGLHEVTPARHAEHRESIVQLDVEVDVEAFDEDALVAALRARVDDVRGVTDVYEPMCARIDTAAAAFEATGEDDDSEVAALLRWVLDDNMVLLGVSGDDGPALGLLTPEREASLEPPAGRQPTRFSICRSRRLSPVQRRSPVELITVRTPQGTVLTIAGLITRKGVIEPSLAMPMLRRRLYEVFERQDVVEGSHDAVVLTSLFEGVPKDELLRCDVPALEHLLVTLHRAEEFRAVRVLPRGHQPSGDLSVLLAAPRDRWTDVVRMRIESYLETTFAAHWIDTESSVTDRQEVLTRFLLLPSSDSETPSDRALTEAIVGITAPWAETTRERLAARTDVDVEVRRRATHLVDELPASYRDVTEPELAVDDLLLLERAAGGDDPLVLALRHEELRTGTPLRITAAKRGAPLELSAFLPILESLGLLVVDEFPYQLVTNGGPRLTLHDFGVRSAHLDPNADAGRVSAAIDAAWRGHLEVDPLNQLIVVAGLSWRDVAVLRTYRRLRRQLGSRYTASYVQGILAANPGAVRALIAYFNARFDPTAPRAPEAATAARDAVLSSLNALARLDHDRVLRGLLTLIDATLRTNAFRPDACGEDGEPYISLKFDPAMIPGVPAPLPYREIFVHSPRVEGVHLRAGPVARGGIRWSDRYDDVRAEVLDLMKAQVLKNSVIVPTGAKGGFVIAREHDDPAELRAEVRRQYVTFVRGLLDVTDDLEDDEVVAPPNVVRHDGDDPYLVVAADRGTATFSDTANALAEDYGFWLADAFASGGSQGYDHKALGVTARGAWVAVRRHFRELGVDVDTEPITVAGVGDMSGDVFGNGLLRSRTVRLIAAFDHRHIFLDPDPDPETSFAERQRLFDLPRSSWADYDREVLSKGGQIVDRSARRVVLSEEVRTALRIDETELTPLDLIQKVLGAPVDLLFAGGIGTYIKATTERHEDVGDRTNDELRIDATDVRARVLGEGANLFITQRGRVELAKRGCRLNQDAVDNVAGVATSDLEVNLKILLGIAEKRGELTRADRNAFLTEVTDDVVDEVLATVDRQTVAISREMARSPKVIDAYQPLLARLERDADLDRDVEVLPDEDEFARRASAGAGLTRPELGTLVAWAKRDLKELALASDLPESPLSQALLPAAFLPAIRERYGHLIPDHRLRRELIATRIANTVVDRVGVTFANQLAEELGRSIPEVLHGFLAVRVVIDAERWWGHLDELEADQAPDRVRELEAPVEELIANLTRVMLADPSAQPPDRIANSRAQVATVILNRVAELGTPEQRRARVAHARWLIDDLVHPEIARFLACTRDLLLTPDVAAVRQQIGTVRRVDEIVDGLLRVGALVEIDRLDEALRRDESPTVWGRRQRSGLSMDLRQARRVATADALATDPSAAPEEAVALWVRPRRTRLEGARAVIRTALAEGHRSTDALGVAVRQVRETVRFDTE